jgi:hypothetical protein
MVYRTMQGQIIDMDKLMQKHELTPAVGNAKMNARGDKLGPGGKIIKTREEVVAEYYENNPKAKTKAAGARVVEAKPQEPVSQPQQTAKSKKSQTEE